MDVKEKIIKALSRSLDAEEVRLDVDDGISGFVVTPRFKGVSMLDRQTQIDEALNNAPLSADERRQILMIAGLTPDEYQAAGGRIRVHEIREMAGGAVEIVLHGGLSDALYVRDAFQDENDIQTGEPKDVAGANGILMYFRAKGTRAKPLTKKKALSVLRKNRHIEVLPNA